MTRIDDYFDGYHDGEGHGIEATLAALEPILTRHAVDEDPEFKQVVARLEGGA